MTSIYEFKKRDIITRVVSSLPLGHDKKTGMPHVDRSYIGNKMLYVGIANGKIYLQRLDSLPRKLFGDSLVGLPLDIFEEGWDYYIDPKTLLDDVEGDINISKEELEIKLKRAIDIEDYNKASIFHKMLKNLDEKQ
jgi:hypothetical protein